MRLIGLYGLLARFDSAEELIAAAEKAREAGYRKLDAYTPFPVHGLADALGVRQTRLPYLVLLGGLLGAAGGFFLQWYGSVVDYPLNVGGRPYNSWPAFIIISFELTVLFAGLTAVIGMLVLNGLPQPYHPLFNVPEFELASRTHFFLSIEASDPAFDRERTRKFLEGLFPDETGPEAVWEVPLIAVPRAE
jgi:hypothetical protein